MEISKKLASQIVEVVYEVVKKDTNLIQPSGLIIGSTDRSRIGTYHTAGAYAITQGLPVSVDKEHPFQGAREGINYPIFLDTQAIAAIGITGNPEELKAYGFLITKITEVFLKEQKLNQEMLSKDRALHYLITSLIYDNIPNQTQFDALIREYELDPSSDYAALSVRFQDASLEPSLRFYFASIGCPLSLYLYPNEWVVLFHHTQFEQFHPDDFSARYQGSVAAGLGDFVPLYQIFRSYANARIARKHAQSQQLDFCDIQDISIEFLIESIPVDMKNIYASRVLGKLTEKERSILLSYLSNNLALKETAEQLFIHKNTLQYQLDRIAEKTNLNPRHFQDAFLLNFALLCK